MSLGGIGIGCLYPTAYMMRIYKTTVPVFNDLALNGQIHWILYLQTLIFEF